MSIFGKIHSRTGRVDRGVDAASAINQRLVSSNRSRPADPSATSGESGALEATEGEDDMADDKSIRAPQDSSRIAMNEDYEVEYWTNRFGVSRDGLP